MKLGAFQLNWLRGGSFSPDGGLVFGPVPRRTWARLLAPDEENRVHFPADPLLIRTPSHTVLVDTGVGAHLTERQRAVFGVRVQPEVLLGLARLGVRPQAVDVVVLSHLHFDHTGAAVDQATQRPLFPNARYVVQRVEWEDARQPTARNRYVHLTAEYLPLEAAGNLWLVEGRVEVAPGIEVVLTGGHSRGYQCVLVDGGGACAIAVGDLVPTHLHLNPLWVQASDDYPLDSIEAKREWLGRATSEGWWLAFYHDPFYHAGVFDRRNDLVQSLKRANPTM